LKIFELLQDLLVFKKGKVIFNGQLGQLPWGWVFEEFIMVNNPQWFKDVSIEYMTEEEKKDLRLESIRSGFRKLKEASEWVQKHHQMTLKEVTFMESKLLPAVEVIYTELEKLEVPISFSTALFLMDSSQSVEELVEQYR